MLPPKRAPVPAIPGIRDRQRGMGRDKPSDSEVTEPDVLLEEFQQTLEQFVSAEGGRWPQRISNKLLILLFSP